MKYVLLILFAAGFSLYGQGTFQNLDFESATIVPDQSNPPLINAAAALPGWTVVSSGFGSGAIMYNTVPIGNEEVTLQGPSSLEPILQGSYSVILFGASGGGPGNAAIGQTGQIPIGTQTLLFAGAQIVNLQVSFNGQALSYTPVVTGPNFTTYGADISMFAGQTGQLLFNAPPHTGGEFDDIRFSPTAIPEPSTLALGALGMALLCWQHWRKAAR